MKNYVIFLITLPIFLNAQDGNPGWFNSEVFFITAFVGGETVHYHAEPIGTRWTADDTSPPSNFTITTDYGEGWYPDINEPGMGNVNPLDPYNYFRDCNGFDFVNARPYYNDYILSYGIYKLSISEGGRNAYFYLDYRDTRYRTYTVQTGSAIDVWFIYDGWYDQFGFRRYNCPITINPIYFNDIENGEYLTIWDIKEQSPNLSPATEDFEDYWENCLVIIPSIDNHPKLIWGPYPNNPPLQGNIIGYKIYRSDPPHIPGYPPGDFSLLATVNLNEFKYTDNSVTMGSDYRARSYYVKCVYDDPWEGTSQTSPTNTVEVRLENPSKRSDPGNKAIQNFTCSLEQNHPNPFNQTTKIGYSINTTGWVTLKVYDVLGKEVDFLLNERKEPGNYSVSFNAENLPTGIYIYKLTAGKFTAIKKLMLLK